MSLVRLLQLALTLSVASSAQISKLTVYNSTTAQLAPTLQSWSYGKFSVSAPAPAGLPSGGTKAMSLAPDWSSGLYLHGSLVFLYGDLKSISFYAYNNGPEVASLKLNLCGGDGNAQAGLAVTQKSLPANAWTPVTIQMSAFSNGTLDPRTQINCLKMTVPPASAASGSVLLADVVIQASLRSEASVSVSVGSTPEARKVSPHLFGVNFAEDGTFPTANRWGGNAVTRYSWELDVQNRANDFFFENIPNPAADAKALPANSTSDRFIESSLRMGALPVITIPTIGYSPIDRVKRCGFSIAKYGAQKSHDKYAADCGNGVKTDGSDVVGNDPTDISKVVGPEYAVQWLQHLVSYHGPSIINQSVFILDNEPNYWSGTHRDVHPKELTYDEMWNYTVAYSTALKAAFPHIRLAGPDTASYAAITKYVEKLVVDVVAHETKTGVRLLDVLDIHCYPEARYDASRMTTEQDVTVRMRLHRELWDPSYYTESYQAVSAYYLRRLRSAAPAWMTMSCTEWNYQTGFSDADVVGAVISLDVLGVYVREGVSLANKWGAPKPGSVLEYALLQMLNQFGQNGGGIVGASYVNASTSSDMVGAHGFLSDSGQLHVLVVCRQVADGVSVQINAPFSAGTASIYRLDTDHQKMSTPEKATVASSELQVTMPAVSAALVVFDIKAPAPAPAPPAPPAGSCNGCGYACGGSCTTCGRCNTKPGCMSQTQCLGTCNSGGNAMWCGSPSPPPPTPTPPPAPSDCPGGTLSACIGLCPSNPPVAYQACVQACVSRCTSI